MQNKLVAPKKYFLRLNGEIVDVYSSLKLARKHVKNIQFKHIDNKPATVEIIKQTVIEEVISVYQTKSIQVFTAIELDKDFYK